MSWSIVRNEIKFNDGKKASFDHAIEEVVEVAGVLVVILDVPADKVMTENVFGISMDARKLWQVERLLSTATDLSNVYVGVSNHTGDVVCIANWNGMLVEIDVRTGKMLKQRFGK